jgi:hypothetical protein
MEFTGSKSDIFLVPLLRFDDRFRELFKLPGLRQREFATSSEEDFQAGRCQRTTHADGRPFWSYTWQSPVQNLVPQGDAPVQAQANRDSSTREQHLPAA